MPAPRRQDIELLRCVAAFGIVWFHTTPAGQDLAYGGLVAFVALSTLLAVRGEPLAGRDGLARRARRLLRPWALWFAIYLALNAALGRALLPSGTGPLTAVLAGPSIHLWYLPFVFVLLCGLDWLRPRVDPRHLALAAGGLAVAGLAGAPWWRPWTLAQPYPFLQWADGAVPALAGVFLGLAGRLAPGPRRLLLAALLGVAALVAPQPKVGIAFVVGLGACALIASDRAAGRWRIDLTPLSSLSFGVYLAHSLVLVLLLRQLPLQGAALPLATFALAAAGVALLRRAAPRLGAALT
ncbi:acyltransferase family protein [Piscinibacter sakaiensis]|uniref:Putative integral membrane protein n=1 Tax=Piscinibacter sakaiensis TaxID=1547922 RepID=A0A0K8NUD0_PISS1|nr:acyltransferase family protein [Piscinibacter sakaiensis]GAP33879.1 putative integral membrane protein [Piscinibacter sakaiensis]